MVNETIDEREQQDEISDITNSDVTDFFRDNVPRMGTEEIRDLQDLSICRERYSVSYPVLKKIPDGATGEVILSYAQVNGYNRWSTQCPIATSFRDFLVLTQWYERSRNQFAEWRSAWEQENANA